MKNDLFLIKKNKVYSKWTSEEDGILMENLKTLKIRNKWKTVSKILNKKVYDCINRYKAINPAIKKGHWTKEEDSQVETLIEIYGKNWAKISIIMKKRTGKQIRQRFLNFLDPKIKKDKFSIDEDMKIFKLFKLFGTNWRYYVKYIPNRTADMIKGRYYSSIRFKENILRIVDGLSEEKISSKNPKVQENTSTIEENLMETKIIINKINNKNEKVVLGEFDNKNLISTKFHLMDTQFNTTNSFVDSNDYFLQSDESDNNKSSVSNLNNTNTLTNEQNLNLIDDSISDRKEFDIDFNMQEDEYFICENYNENFMKSQKNFDFIL